MFLSYFLQPKKQLITLPKVWSSVESFPSIASNYGPSLEQYRVLGSQLNEAKRENVELVKHN